MREATIIDRMFRAAALDTGLYEEVEADRNLTREALLVVLIGAVAAGIGLGLAASLAGLVLGIAGAVLSWAVFAGLAYVVGTRVLAEPTTESDWGEMLRTTGYAHAPRVLLVTLFIPIVGAIISLAVAVWVLLTTIFAVRQALDYRSTARAVVTSVIAWVAEIGVLGVLIAIAA